MLFKEIGLGISLNNRPNGCASNTYRFGKKNHEDDFSFLK